MNGGVSATARIDGRTYTVELDRAVCIATPLRFDGRQPNAFGLPLATAAPFSAGTFVADTRAGGSVNCDVVTLAPHGNGTHTECVGHIAIERFAVADLLPSRLWTAALLTVRARPLAESSDTYPPGQPDDLIVDAASLGDALAGVPGATECDALVLRIDGLDDLPTRRWSGETPPYFTVDAMASLAQGSWRHLLTELPSVDRDDDQGALLNHRAWWGVPVDRHVVSPSERTITEMVVAPRSVPDGLYALTIEIPAFVLDAAPSRPSLFPLRALSDD